MQTICQGCIYLPPGQGVSTEEGQHSGWGPGLCSALHSAHCAQHGQSWHWPWHRGQGEIVIIFILALHHCDLWYIRSFWLFPFNPSYLHTIYLFIKRILMISLEKQKKIQFPVFFTPSWLSLSCSPGRSCRGCPASWGVCTWGQWRAWGRSETSPAPLR